MATPMATHGLVDRRYQRPSLGNARMLCWNNGTGNIHLASCKGGTGGDIYMYRRSHELTAHAIHGSLGHVGKDALRRLPASWDLDEEKSSAS